MTAVITAVMIAVMTTVKTAAGENFVKHVAMF